jgi:hypothetical protein
MARQRGARELFFTQIEQVGKEEYLYKYPPNVQMYNESWLDLVEGIRELIITQAGRDKYLCMVISSTHPMCKCIMRDGWTWLRGKGSFSLHRWAVANTVLV